MRDFTSYSYRRNDSEVQPHIKAVGAGSILQQVIPNMKPTNLLWVSTVLTCATTGALAASTSGRVKLSAAGKRALDELVVRLASHL